jgi:hypothetical protein
MSGQSMARRRCANEEWDGTLIIRFGFVCASSSVSPRPHTVSDLVSCLRVLLFAIRPRSAFPSHWFFFLFLLDSLRTRFTFPFSIVPLRTAIHTHTYTYAPYPTRQPSIYSLSLFLFWFAVHHSLFWFPLHLTIGFPLVVIVYISYCRLLAARGTPY